MATAVVLQESLGSSLGASGLGVQLAARVTPRCQSWHTWGLCLLTVGIQMLQHILSEKHLVAGLLTWLQQSSSVKNYTYVLGV